MGSWWLRYIEISQSSRSVIALIAMWLFSDTLALSWRYISANCYAHTVMIAIIVMVLRAGARSCPASAFARSLQKWSYSDLLSLLNLLHLLSFKSRFVGEHPGQMHHTPELRNTRNLGHDIYICYKKQDGAEETVKCGCARPPRDR